MAPTKVNPLINYENYIALILLLTALNAAAKVKLPSLINDNMILQQRAEVNLWGEATPGNDVHIKCKSRSRWEVGSYASHADRAIWNRLFTGTNNVLSKMRPRIL